MFVTLDRDFHEPREEILADNARSKMMESVRDLSDKELCEVWTTQSKEVWAICRNVMEETIKEHPEIYNSYFGE